MGTGRVIQTIDLAVPDRADLGSVGYTDLAIASGRIWVTNAITGDVVRSDVFSGESGIVGRILTIHLADLR